MFNKEKLTNYDSRSEYDASPGYDRKSPSYDEMSHPGMGDKVTAPKRFWTRAKLISAAVLAIVILGGIVCISQNIAIQQRQYDIQGKVGDVWNEVDRASQLLQQDAALLNSTIASQNAAIAKIAKARSNAEALKTGQGTTDPKTDRDERGER